MSSDSLSLLTLPTDILRNVIKSDDGESRDSLRLLSPTWNVLVAEYRRKLPPINCITLQELDCSLLLVAMNIEAKHSEYFMRSLPSSAQLSEGKEKGTANISVYLHLTPAAVERTDNEPEKKITREEDKKKREREGKKDEKKTLYDTIDKYLPRLFQRTCYMNKLIQISLKPTTRNIVRKALRGVEINELRLYVLKFDSEFRQDAIKTVQKHGVFDIRFVVNETLNLEELFSFILNISNTSPCIEFSALGMDDISLEKFDSFARELIEKKGVQSVKINNGIVRFSHISSEIRP